MFGLSGAELFIIGLVIVLLFGVGRLTKLGTELGAGLKSFRDAIKDEEPKELEQKNNHTVLTKENDTTTEEKTK